MNSVSRTRVGIQAGLMAGAAVALLFFLFDLARFQPLATPLALGSRMLVPGGFLIDTPILSEAISVTMFAGNLVALTILHFLAFSLLGVGAVWGCEGCGLRLNILTGAIYGVTVGSLVFYGCLSLDGGHVLANLPGPLNVFLANLSAGAVMGGFAQFARRRVREKTSSPDTVASPA